MTPAAIVSKLWNYCNVLRDDGMSYGDYVEQLTYLPFLKMADEAHEAAIQPAECRSREVQLAHALKEGRRRSVRCSEEETCYI